jgi:hypothetical protein
MSSVRLLLSGSLVAGGLILGAFTLHGAFDPYAAQKRQTADRGLHGGPKGINAFQTKTRLVTGETVAQDGARQPPLVKASAKSSAKPAEALSAEERAARAAARRKLAEKKRAEKAQKEKAEREKLAKAKQQPQPQQATLQWPWSWFGSN